MKLRQLLIVKLEFPIDDSGQKLSNVNAALEKLIVCPTQLPTIHVRNYALFSITFAWKLNISRLKTWMRVTHSS